MLYVSLGLQSSASTWVYNVIRAVLKQRDIACDGYTNETVGDVRKYIRKRARAHVWKAHNLQMAVLRMIELGNIPLIVSVRDPRDAAASLVSRFGGDPTDAVHQITRSLASVFSAVSSVPKALVFEYEMGFPEKAESVRAIAEAMGVALSAAEVEAIRAEYSLERVKEFTSRLDALPDERLRRRGTDTMDTETQFHRSHVSDAAVGKWRKVFPANLHNELDRMFEPLLGMAFYEPGMTLTFRPQLFRGGANQGGNRKAQYREGGQCLVENAYLGQGVWSLRLSIDGKGGMQGAKGVRVVHDAAERFATRFDPPPANASYQFELVCGEHDSPVEAFLLFDAPPTFQEGRIPRATLEATFVGPL